jgi:hypothetical protein
MGEELATGVSALGGVTVRREKALDFSGCNSRPETGSLHHAVAEAAIQLPPSEAGRSFIMR